MPGFDRTGPWGAGPMTGGRRGLCASRSAGGNWSSRGRGFGRGMGRGLGRCTSIPVFYDDPYSSDPWMNRDNEIEFLRNQAKTLRDELDDIESRLSGLEKRED